MTHLTPSHFQPLRRAWRSGISLLEVLISMGVLAVGIMGVAALIPAGRFEILQGAKADHASMVGRAALRKLKIRGYLNPASLQTLGGTAFYDPTTPQKPFAGGTNANLAIAIDPLGLTAPTTFSASFPYNPIPSTPLPVSLVRVFPSTAANSAALADPIFRNGDDLLFAASTTKNAPPVQQMMGSNAKRTSNGDYSWLATVVAEPTPPALVSAYQLPNATTSKVTVSVAVFYKRSLIIPTGGNPPENVVSLTMPGSGIGGGEVVLQASSVLAKPGQWIMLAGYLTVTDPNPPNGSVNLNYARWYKVVSADVLDTANNQALTLSGPDWQVSAANTRAWLFDNLIAVYEKSERLELP